MKYKNIIDKSLDAICVIDSANVIQYSNPAFSELTGYSNQELLNQDFSMVLPSDIATVHKDLVDRYVHSDKQSSSVLGKIRRLHVVHKSGEIIPIELKAFELDADPSGARSFAGVLRDLRETEQNLHGYNRLLYDLDNLGFIEPISKLPNEKFLLSRVDEIIANSKVIRESILCVINIDGLDQINQSFGREVGDRLLYKVGKELQQGMRLKDYLGRMESGDFVALFPATSLSDVIHLMDNLRSHISRKTGLVNEDPNLKITISVGCSRILEPVKKQSNYFQEAQQALKRAKVEGKNKLLVYGFY